MSHLPSQLPLSCWFRRATRPRQPFSSISTAISRGPKRRRISLSRYSIRTPWWGTQRTISDRGAVATAVVARLELDRDPHFVGLPVSWRALAAMRLALRLGAPQIAPSPRELAIAALMNRVTVTNEPRSYLISISFSANDPERAAIVANTVALEYLRAETAERVDRRLAAAEQEAAAVSLVYGSQHPARQHSEEKLKRLRESLDALRRGSDLADSSKFDGGSSLIPAQRDDVPSNPDVNLALGLASLVGLAIGVWMALYLRGSTAVGTCDELRGDPPARGAAPRAQSR